MYESDLKGNLVRSEELTGIYLFTLLLRLCCGIGIIDILLFLIGLIIDPIIDSNSPFRVLLYFISQFKARHMTLPKYIVQCGRTNTQFLCYASLFLIISLHPCCEFIHFTLFFCLFFWKKIRYSDTIVSISRRGLNDKLFFRIRDRLLTYIKLYDTM
jgi:hypothetical protein